MNLTNVFSKGILLAQALPDKMQTPPVPEPTADVSNAPNLMTSFEFYLSCIVLVFGLIGIFAIYKLGKNRNLNNEEILKLFLVTVIVVAVLFVISAGYGDRQIAPAMGLFGSVIGYLFGRQSTKEEPPQQQTSKPSTEKNP